ncbi:MAG TPA: CRISPR-associated endonuclease Cas1 [Methanocorpusculum sp.]|nr:CRISPR-associated endonuclease Cas1 [Methanocorpusculum sp.]
MRPWVTVWGYGTDISATQNTLFVREKGSPVPARYPLSEISHLLIAGDNVLHTSAVLRCAEQNIPISFFDIRGRPSSVLQKPSPSRNPASDSSPVHTSAKSMIESAIEARMRFLHELAETHEDFYRVGEFDIIAGARAELDYLITLPELARIFTLTKNMYYEILSRVLSAELGYRRRVEGISPDPVNVLFSKGYAALYATVQTACIGAGLDLSRSSIFGKVIPCTGSPCVREIMEPALVPMVDRVVIETAMNPDLCMAYQQESRWMIPITIEDDFYQRLSASIDVPCIEANVEAYAEALHEGAAPEYHYPT